MLLDELSRPPDEVNDPNGASLNWVKIAKGSTKVDLVGTALGYIIAHESGHNFGAFHTEQLNANHNVMDRGGPGLFPFLGPDGIFGTKDDVDVDFGVENLTVLSDIAETELPPLGPLNASASIVSKGILLP